MKTKQFYRFYLEYAYTKDKRKGTRANLGKHIGTCLAVPYDKKQFGGLFYHSDLKSFDCYGAVYYRPNSACGGISTTAEYLQNWCKRISEKQAREIHPALFEYLEYEP